MYERNLISISSGALAPATTGARFLLSLLLVGAFALAGCDSSDESDGVSPEDLGCETVDGQVLAANVDGEPFCAALFNARVFVDPDTGIRRLVIITQIESRGRNMDFIIEDPSERSVDLATAGGRTLACYRIGATAEQFAANSNRGEGTVTIDELTGDRVRGTFAFTGVEDSRDTPPVVVTDGSFDVALGPEESGSVSIPSCL